MTQMNPPLHPSIGEVIVRFYRQGLGDCFLLSFGSAAGPRHVLIDCGVHKCQEDGKARLRQVVENIAAATRGTIHIVIISHPHADHLSGFLQRDSPLWQIQFDRLWLSWTENSAEPEIAQLREDRHRAYTTLCCTIDQALNIDPSGPKSRSKIHPALRGQIDRASSLLSFLEYDFDMKFTEQVRHEIQSNTGLNRHKMTLLRHLINPKSKTAALGAEARFNALDALEFALGRLILRSQPEFCLPGEVKTIPDIPDVGVYILGPPRFAKPRPGRENLPEPDRGEEILVGYEGANDQQTLQAHYNTSFFWTQTFTLSPGFLHASATVPDYLKRPFDSGYYQNNNDLQNWFAAQSERNLSQHDNEHFWRQIDKDWLSGIEPLAISLDSDINNSSLALAIELGPPGQGPVLLFPGDAQIGTWLQWRRRNFRRQQVKISADQLLKRTLLYKVSQRGSPLATPKYDPNTSSHTDRSTEPFGLELMDNIIAILPTIQGNCRPHLQLPWMLPHPPLYKRLCEKAQQRVLRCEQKLPFWISNLGSATTCLEEVIPPSTTWSNVPGLSQCAWRRSESVFSENPQEPVFYDIRISWHENKPF